MHPVRPGEPGLADVAARQGGRVHLAQVKAAGFSRKQIATLLRRETLIRLYPRVYALGHTAPTLLADEVAAMLYVGHDAAISHRSAAAMWGFATAGDEVDVTLIGRDSRRCGPIVTYRVPMLDSRDVRLRNGLPVTAPARTLIDFAAEATELRLSDAAGDARAMRLVSDAQLDDALGRAPLRSGTRAVIALRATPEGRLLTRSHVERILLRLLTDADLPLPLTNTTVNGHDVDAYWPEHNLVLEVDSWKFHSSRRAFETDRARDQDHTARRIRSLRFTYRQMTQEPLRTVAKIASALHALA
jgi:very-short-patch-repair endonuclease